MPCVGNNALATLPSYSVNLVCHLPFKEVEALRLAETSTRCKPSPVGEGGPLAVDEVSEIVYL